MSVTKAYFQTCVSCPALTYYVCTTDSEKPTSGLNVGDLAIITNDGANTGKIYKATSTTAWSELASGGAGVPTTRLINTTAPLAGGGDLSADRTLTVGDATTSAKGVVELATSGESAANVVVQGNDARLSDARTPLAHNHTASEITSGVIAMARLATGTPDGTKFIADDGTLKTPSGGGGPTKVRKTGDQTKTDGTLVNATDLSFSVVANTTYRFKFGLIFRSTVATVGLKCTVTFPAVTVFAATARIPIAVDGAGMEFQGAISSSGDAVTGSAVPAINVDYFAVVEGIIRPSANGTLQLQFAAETTGATVTLKANSVGELDTYA